MSEHLSLGAYGERCAAEYLEQLGFHILERNWRCRAGELDLVAQDGAVLAVIEVKTRKRMDCGHPFEAITPRKLARLYRLGTMWCAENRWRGAFRVDAVAVLANGVDPVRIEHLRGVC
ncbi:MAG: YraN family protein [Agromyces sp.]